MVIESGVFENNISGKNHKFENFNHLKQILEENISASLSGSIILDSNNSLLVFNSIESEVIFSLIEQLEEGAYINEIDYAAAIRNTEKVQQESIL